MRVRVVRWTDPISSGIKLDIQRWCAGQWEHVVNYPLPEAENAYEFAKKLSLTARVPVETVVFEDGMQLSGEPV